MHTQYITSVETTYTQQSFYSPHFTVSTRWHFYIYIFALQLYLHVRLLLFEPSDPAVLMCQDNMPIASCEFNPCFGVCPAYPNASCQINFCESCSADYVFEGSIIDCFEGKFDPCTKWNHVILCLPKYINWSLMNPY